MWTLTGIAVVVMVIAVAAYLRDRSIKRREDAYRDKYQPR